jgi:predicted Rossmann fold flavoprotein
VLAKVKVSGGGRCNVTNGNHDVNSLVDAYPRGGKQLKNIFYNFSTQDTFNWFESRGVALKTEADGRVFPISNSSQTIIDCLLSETEKLGISIHYNKGVNKLYKKGEGWEISLNNTQPTISFDSVIIATGGNPKEKGFEWLKNLDHEIQSPVPSLFTFNIPKEPITQLMGLAVESVQLKIKGEGILTKGPLLITHWGFSGPAVLVASSRGARNLAALNYQFEIEVNWLQEQNTALLFDELQEVINYILKKLYTNKKGLSSLKDFGNFLSKRLVFQKTNAGMNLERKKHDS